MPVKKRVSKNKKPLTAKPENYFVLATGVPLKNLKELAHALENMNEWVFNHHVNEYRNDFGSWIKDVLREKELSSEMEDVNTPYGMELKIMRHLMNKYL